MLSHSAFLLSLLSLLLVMACARRQRAGLGNGHPGREGETGQQSARGPPAPASTFATPPASEDTGRVSQCTRGEAGAARTRWPAARAPQPRQARRARVGKGGGSQDRAGTGAALAPLLPPPLGCRCERAPASRPWHAARRARALFRSRFRRRSQACAPVASNARAQSRNLFRGLALRPACRQTLRARMRTDKPVSPSKTRTADMACQHGDRHTRQAASRHGTAARQHQPRSSSLCCSCSRCCSSSR